MTKSQRNRKIESVNKMLKMRSELVPMLPLALEKLFVRWIGQVYFLGMMGFYALPEDDKLDLVAEFLSDRVHRD